jgi:hypothetical protein
VGLNLNLTTERTPNPHRHFRFSQDPKHFRGLAHRIETNLSDWIIKKHIQKNEENCMHIKKLALFAITLVLLTACQAAGPSAKDLAATTVADAAKTVEAAPLTATPVPVATETSVPAPTATITPTSAPTLTSTPSGPLTIKDDFSKKSDIWGKCDKCEWKDGKLYLGPFEPKGNGINQLFPIVCEACGEHTYFRIAADITFTSGYGDRFYGVGGIIPDKFYAGSGISTVQYGALEIVNYGTNKYSGSKATRYGALKPGSATNHVEFLAKPNASGGLDYYEIVNGKKIIVLENRQPVSLKPSLYLAWHSVGVTFDNFEFEELVP